MAVWTVFSRKVILVCLLLYQDSCVDVVVLPTVYVGVNGFEQHHLVQLCIVWLFLNIQLLLQLSWQFKKQAWLPCEIKNY